MQADGWQRETTNYGHTIRPSATWDNKLWTCNETVSNIRPQTMDMQADGWQRDTTNYGHTIRRSVMWEHKLWPCNQTVSNVRAQTMDMQSDGQQSVHHSLPRVRWCEAITMLDRTKPNYNAIYMYKTIRYKYYTRKAPHNYTKIETKPGPPP